MTQSVPQIVRNDLKARQILRIIELKKLRALLKTASGKATAYLNSLQHQSTAEHEKATAEENLEKKLHSLEEPSFPPPSLFEKIWRKFVSFFQ